MNKIDGSVLKKLREAKGWSQEELAKNTKNEGLPQIDKQTISRIERGERDNARPRTIKQIARALRVDTAVLTGEVPPPEMELDTEPGTPKSQLNIRVSTAARNALNLVAQHYVGVRPSQIIELAPFLFCWAAEQSLGHRRDRLTELEGTLEKVRELEGGIWDGPPVPDFEYLEQQIEAEGVSISLGDVCGIYEEPELSNASDPFTAFLRNLTADFSGIAKFEDWLPDGSPTYTVFADEAALNVGGNRDIAELILRGIVALNEMPKEIREPEKRGEWVLAKALEAEKKRQKELMELDERQTKGKEKSV